MTGRLWAVTGGAGYIGSHVVRALLASGRDVLVIDDLSTGKESRVPAGVPLAQGSVLDPGFLTGVLGRNRPTGVIHLAGKKSPAESVSDPLLYARENVDGLRVLLESAAVTGCGRVVFSSSASVYGAPAVDLVDEDHPTVPANPYGDSKLYGERLLAAAAQAHGLGAVSLRYFNVVGAAEPRLADDGIHNLVPLVFQALRLGRSPVVFGNDYDTPDGTCVRDYIDVEDVADAHVRVAELLETQRTVRTFNVGRGAGASVLEVLAVIAAVTGLDVAPHVGPRRPGDPASVVGNVDRITRELGWRAKADLVAMVTKAWQAETAAVAGLQHERVG